MNIFRNIVGGSICLTFLLISSVLGCAFFNLLFFPLFFISPRLWTFCADSAGSSWLVMLTGVLEYILGVRIKVTGDKIQRDKPCLFIMNHRCHLDWLFCFMLFQKCANIFQTKVVLKQPLKHAPGMGWATQLLRFVFVKRNWEQDKEHMTKILDYYINSRLQLQLLLFPEGTDITEVSLAKSNSFAQKNGLPEMKNCLHPRMTGFTFVVDKLREDIGAINDITIGYPDNRWYGEIDLLNGRLPEEIHFHLRTYPINDVPKDTKLLEEWCQEKWYKKNQMLEYFYNNKHFNHKKEIEAKHDMKHSMLAWLVVWGAFTLFECYLLYQYSLVWWLFGGSLAYIICVSCTIGHDVLFLHLHSWEPNNN